MVAAGPAAARPAARRPSSRCGRSSRATPQFQPSPPTSGLAIASLILSISAFVALPLVGSIAGVVCGHMARSKLRQSGYASEGNGLALAGVIIGWVGIAFWVGLIALIVIGLSV